MRSRALTITLISLGVFAVVLGMRELRLLQGFELLVNDQYVRYAARSGEKSPRVVIVEITEEDIREQGHYPFSDRVLAQGLRAIVRADARVIGLDIYRDLSVPPGAAKLDQLLRDEPRIYAVRKSADDGSSGIPGPTALRGTERVGFNDQVLDADGTVRRGLLFIDGDSGTVDYAFALRVALAALTKEGIQPQPDPEHPEWLRLGPTTIPPFDGHDGGYAGEDDAGYQFLLDFPQSAPGFESITFGELLRPGADLERLRDRVVLVGVNAQSLPDVFLLPLGGGARNEKLPGVLLHAHLVDQLMRYGLGEGAPIRVLSDTQEALLILLMALLGGIVSAAVWGTTATVAAVLTGAGILWLAGAAAYRAGWWIPMVGPGLAWMASVGVATALSSSRERVQRGQIMQLLSRLVSHEIADEVWHHRDELLHDGRLRSQRLTASVLFLDMRGYTKHAEKLDPEQLMEWLNDFMQPMAGAVADCGGVVDDFFGDGLKANFGAPFRAETPEEVSRDARRAVDCALQMVRALTPLNQGYRQRGLPTVSVRIGVHTGEVVVGSLGSLDRMKYTSVGDVVIIAERLESVDGVEHDYERWPGRILMTAQTLSHLDERYASEPLGLFSLKGIGHEVEIHRVVYDAGPE